MIRRLVFRACLAGFAAVAAVAALRATQVVATSRISGVVVSTDVPPTAVRRAIVTLTGAGVNGKSAITDDQGKFTFEGLPPGRFGLTASKPAHITNAYGAKAPGRPGVPVSVTADQSVANLTLVLPRGAAVSGSVRDHTGEPASGVQVYVVRTDDPGAATPAAARPEAILTDDRGTYRAYGLAPGSYIVAAALAGIGLGEMTVRSAAEVDELMRQQQQQLRGRVSAPPPVVTSSPAATPVPAPVTAAPKPQTYMYAPIFYPGTANGSDAERLTLHAGEDRYGIDLTLDLVPIGTIEGVAVNPGGPVPELTMTIASAAPALPGVFGMTSLSGRPGSRNDPSFKFVNVTPGHYTITARTSNTRTIYTDGGGFKSEPVEPGSVPILWGVADVDVGGNGLAGVTLQLQPAMTFSGRVAFDASSLKPPEDLTSLRVMLSGASNFTVATTMVNGQPVGPATPVPSSAAVKADGTFEVTGLMPGRYNVTSVVPGAGGPNGWWLRSAEVEGRDVVDSLLTLGSAGSAAGAVLTFSDRHAELSGTLRTSASQPATEFFVIVFPKDKELWRAGSRRVKATRPASDGHFAFPDLPPGDYVLAALDDVTAGEWQSPAFLAQVAGAGVTVTVAPGEKKVQNLQMSGR